MTTIATSNYATYLSLLTGLNNTTSQIGTLSNQLTSGIQSQSLAGYGAQANLLLSLKANYASAQGYSTAISLAQTQVNATATALTSIQSIASTLLSSSNIPSGAGTPTISAVTPTDTKKLAFAVDSSNSTFNVGGTYTVSSVPTVNGPEGAYDVTVSDGQGGTSTKTVNPKDINGTISFQLSGGPGNGSAVGLQINTLAGTTSSTFNVSYAGLNAPKALIQGQITQLQSLLNTQAGGNYIFSGTRTTTPPVGNLISAKQTSMVTLNGSVSGKAGDVYEVDVNGKAYTYTTTGAAGENTQTVLNNIANQINQPTQTALANGQTPALPVVASVTGNTLSFTGINPNQSFTVSSQAYLRSTYNNTSTGAATPADPGYQTYTSHTDNDAVYSQYTSVLANPTATPPVAQQDQVNFNGSISKDPNGDVIGGVDVGDVFSIQLGARNTNTVTSTSNGSPSNVSYDTVAGPTTYKYVMTAADVQAAMADPNGPMNYVAQKLTAQINADPAAPAQAAVVLPASPPATAPFNTAQVQLTGTSATQKFATASTVTNGNAQSTLTPVTLSPYQDVGSIDTSLAQPPYLSTYDTQYVSGAQNAQAYATQSVNATDSQMVSYGVSSNDPAIQTLVLGLRQMLAAVNNPGQYNALMNQARSNISSAQNQLQSLSAQTVGIQSQLSTASTTHSTTMTDASTQIGSIQGINQTTVTEQLQALLTQQQAAYTATGKINGLSLVNFIS